MYRNTEGKKFPRLEDFYFRRIVFDEFHELEENDAEALEILNASRAHYVWGLTGTPNAESVRSVAGMASLFRIDTLGVSLERAQCLDRIQNSAKTLAPDIFRTQCITQSGLNNVCHLCGNGKDRD